MGPKFAIRDNAVNTHGTNLQEAESQLNGNASAFINAISELPQVWQGTSFGSWEQLTTAWSDAMANLNKSLSDIKGRVSNAGQIYDQSQQEQTDALNTAFASSDFDAANVRI